MIPAVQLADQHQTGSWAALVAVVRAGAIAIVEPEAIAAAADRARAMPVDEEPGRDPELRQDLPPAPARTLDRVHDARLAFAHAIRRERTQARVASLGGSGSADHAIGQWPKRCLCWYAAQPGL